MPTRTECLEQCRVARGFEPKVLVGHHRGRPPARGATDKSALNQVRLVDLFDRVRLLADGNRTVFLASSEAAFSGVFRKGDLVAELRITEVTTDSVSVVDGAEQEMTWRVGSSISKRDGVWGASEQTVIAAKAATEGPVASGTAAGVGEKEPKGASTSGMDMLKILQERRKKELAK